MKDASVSRQSWMDDQTQIVQHHLSNSGSGLSDKIMFSPKHISTTNETQVKLYGEDYEKFLFLETLKNMSLNLNETNILG